MCRVTDGIVHIPEHARIPELVPLQLATIFTSIFTGYSYIDYYIYFKDAIAQIDTAHIRL